MRMVKVLVALTALVAIAAVPTAGPVGAEDPPALPAFYDVPDPLPAGAPGDIIRSEVVDAPDLHGTLVRILYHSRSIQGADIAVSGFLAIPSTEPPDGGYPVVAWAHGTTGIADECAPSLGGRASSFNDLLDQGWVVAATDYEGLGTPGRHPYIVGESEARGVIDSVRAARDLPEAHASSSYVVWGHSQGGHAAMFSLHIADSWAPELDLRGVVAGAPPSQLNLVYDFLKESPYRYYLLMVAAAINAAYGDAAAPLSEVLNPTGIEKLDLVDDGCTGFLGEQTGDIATEDLMVRQADGTFNPYANDTWRPLIEAQDPQNFDRPSPEPLLIIHGGNDEQIPTVSSEILAGQLCATGQELQRWMYPGQSHAGVIGPSSPAMVRWMAARFAGDDAPYGQLPFEEGIDVDATACVQGQVVPAVQSSGEPTTTTEATPTTTVPAYPTAAVPVYASPSYTG